MNQALIHPTVADVKAAIVSMLRQRRMLVSSDEVMMMIDERGVRDLSILREYRHRVYLESEKALAVMVDLADRHGMELEGIRGIIKRKNNSMQSSCQENHIKL